MICRSVRFGCQRSALSYENDLQDRPGEVELIDQVSPLEVNQGAESLEIIR